MKAIFPQTQQVQHGPRMFHIFFGGGGPCAVSTGTRFAPYQGYTIRTHFKGFEEEGLTYSPRAGDSNHFDL